MVQKMWVCVCELPALQHCEWLMDHSRILYLLQTVLFLELRVSNHQREKEREERKDLRIRERPWFYMINDMK